MLFQLDYLIAKQYQTKQKLTTKIVGYTTSPNKSSFMTVIKAYQKRV